MRSPVLVLRAVSKTIRAGIPGCSASVVVLERADLVVHAGERVALVGPPGSGKSTLLLLAAGLLRPDRGEAWRLPGALLAAAAPGRAPPDRLAWADPAARGALLLEVPAGAPVPAWATRAVAVERGRVRAALIPPPARPSFRATSPAGTPPARRPARVPT